MSDLVDLVELSIIFKTHLTDVAIEMSEILYSEFTVFVKMSYYIYKCIWKI